MNSVGLSASLLRVIDRRHKLDRWITYGGMVGPVLFIVHCVKEIQAIGAIIRGKFVVSLCIASGAPVAASRQTAASCQLPLQLCTQVRHQLAACKQGHT